MVRVIYEVEGINLNGEVAYRSFFRNKKLAEQAAKKVSADSVYVRKLSKTEMHWVRL